MRLHLSAFRFFVALVAALFIGQTVAVEPINKSFFSKVAIEGYDPVAYFTQNKAVEGSKKYEYEWMGAKWRFSSAEHQQMFMDDPGKYAPQYGGYCAYAVAKNGTASIEPEQFTVHEGKLYLNYNAEVNSIWLGERDRFIEKADANWPELLKK